MAKSVVVFRTKYILKYSEHTKMAKSWPVSSRNHSLEREGEQQKSGILCCDECLIKHIPSASQEDK